MSEVYQDQLDFAKSNRLTDVVILKSEIAGLTWFVLQVKDGPVIGKFASRSGADAWARSHGFTITNPV